MAPLLEIMPQQIARHLLQAQRDVMSSISRHMSDDRTSNQWDIAQANLSKACHGMTKAACRKGAIVDFAAIDLLDNQTPC
jgi:hypothetical protein